MNAEYPKAFTAAREELQQACSKTYLVLSKHTKRHNQTFIWRMDGGLKKDLFGVNPEDSLTGRFTAEQVRRMIRENGKPYSVSCRAIIPKLMAIATSCNALAGGGRSIQEEINCFRAIVERLAVLEATLQELRSITDITKIENYNQLNEISEAFMGSIETRFNWSALQDNDFCEMSARTDYIHSPEETRFDFTASNILGKIDRLQKKDRYKGVRPFYNFCCEFVHPNFGDIFSATAAKDIIYTQGGQLAYRTKFEESPFHADVSGGREFFEKQKLFISAYKFATRLVEEVAPIADELGGLLVRVERQNKKYIHRTVKTQRRLFSDTDYCPCGSGQTIRSCALGKKLF